MPALTFRTRSKKYLWIIFGLSVLLLLVSIAGNHAQLIERYYSRGLYIPISASLHFLWGWLPLSLGDIFYAFLTIRFLVGLLKIIRSFWQRHYHIGSLIMMRGVIEIQLLMAAFYILWGLNYSRPSASELLALPRTGFTGQEMIDVTCMLIDSTNASRDHLSSIKTDSSNKAIYSTATEAIKNLRTVNPQFESYYPAVKSSAYSPMISFLGTAGYFTPFTGEAQVNYDMPLVDRPVSACHEMAHQMGFAREDEANFVGYLAGINSRNPLLHYSAYYLAADEFMHQIRRRDSIAYHEMKTRYSPAVISDIKADRAYWLRYQNKLSKVSGLFYDQFLKANKQPEGLRTYNRMIILTMGWYKTRAGKKDRRAKDVLLSTVFSH
jgi:hypothetical protein